MRPTYAGKPRLIAVLMVLVGAACGLLLPSAVPQMTPLWQFIVCLVPVIAIAAFVGHVSWKLWCQSEDRLQHGPPSSS